MLLGRAFICLGLGLAGCLALAGCGLKAKRADLVMINGAEPESLDPAIITGQPEGRIVNALFEGLTRFNRQGRPIPGVAESWTMSPDGRTYVFKLRADARWSDGAPVTAQDFVDSWRRTLKPETTASYNYQLFYVKNAKAFADGALEDFAQVGVRAIDPRTLEVRLENPTPFFLDLCATPPLQPVPRRVIERYGDDDWIKPGHIVSNGAFVLDEWRINDRIRLRRNPQYWDRENVRLGSVDVLPIGDPSVAFNFFASGEADLIADKGLAPIALLDDLRKRPDFHHGAFFGTYFLRFRCDAGPFADPRVRRAFSLVVDRDRIVNKITRLGEHPAHSLVPPGIAGYVSPPGLAGDNEEARRLLAEAGYPGGRGFPLVRYLYSGKGAGSVDDSIAVELQAMWQRELGVQISLTRQEWKVYLNSLDSLDYDIARSTWVGDYPDPNTFLDMFVKDGGNNRTGWTDPAYDALIARASTEADPARRFATLAEAEALLIARQTVICPLFYYVGVQLYDPKRVRGVEPNLTDEHPIRLIERR